MCKPLPFAGWIIFRFTVVHIPQSSASHNLPAFSRIPAACMLHFRKIHAIDGTLRAEREHS